MRYFCWNFVSTPSANSDGYPILKTELGSNKVRGRKKRKKARNHATRKPVTMVQTKRRRRRSISVEGVVPATPAAGAALDVPTAGVPTYLVASAALLATGFAASGFGLTFGVSVSAMSSPPYEMTDSVPSPRRSPRTVASPTASPDWKWELR